MRVAARVLPVACLVALAACGPEAIGDPSTSAEGDAGTTSAPPPSNGAPPAPASGGAPAPDAGADQGAPPAHDAIVVAHDIHADGLRASIVRAHDVHAKNATYRQLVLVDDKDDATGGAKGNLDQQGTVEAQEVHAHDIHVDAFEADTVYAHAVKAK
jgi:hypothetical protein